jgi:bile acid:Na+ symporter, BASS family
MRLLLDALALVGRYGTQGFAVSIFLGLALPQFAAAARPLLGFTIFMFVMITFARVDTAALRALLRRPRAIVLANVWLIVAPVVLTLGVIASFGRSWLDPGLVLGLAVLAAAPPIMSAPAVAMMLGLEPTLMMVSVLVTTALAPALSPLLAEFVAGGTVPLDLAVLLQRLLVLIGGAVLAAVLLRRLIGAVRVRAYRAQFDGFGVLMYFLFAVAAMDGVLAAAIANPLRAISYLTVAFGLAAAGFVSAFLVLRWLEPAERFVLGYGTCQRNMGLLIAALGADTPETTFLFFALAQFPIYLMPQIVKPIARRLTAVAAQDPPCYRAAP